MTSTAGEAGARNAGRDADGGGERRHIFQHHRVGAYLGVISNADVSQEFGPSADIDMTTDSRRTPFAGA